jgi:uncharacterized membrane protein YkoI
MKNKVSWLVVALGGLLLVAAPMTVMAAKPPKHRISMESASKVALKTFDGKIESKELEHEGGKWVYSFDIRGNDKAIHEVQVDAKTGEVVSQKVETPAQEKTEAAHENAAH